MHFTQGAMVLQVFVQVAAIAEFKNEVVVVGCLDELLQLYYVLVVYF